MSVFIAVIINKFYNFLNPENSLLCNTIFSNKPKSSSGILAYIKAYTATETSSTFLLSGKAVLTTYSTTYYLCSFSGSNA